MSTFATTSPSQLPCVPQADQNPYATPKSLVASDEPRNRLSNFKLQRLGYTLRAHGILTVTTLAVYVAAFVMMNGETYQWGGLMLMGAVLFSVVLVLLTVMLAFVVFPFLIAILAIASMLIPVTWPLSFIAMHWWGRKKLKDHSMQVGFFKGPQYVAKLADDH